MTPAEVAAYQKRLREMSEQRKQGDGGMIILHSRFRDLGPEDCETCGVNRSICMDTPCPGDGPAPAPYGRYPDNYTSPGVEEFARGVGEP